jgi:hypothetical protein
MWQKLNAVKAINFYKTGYTCPSVQAGITQKLQKKLKFLSHCYQLYIANNLMLVPPFLR